jgi:sugar-specific transcriptional regulator TrmB
LALERLTKKLIDVGFAEDEAGIYLFLSSMGPTPARTVAKRFNLNRMRAYRTLKVLEERGLVQRIMGRPVSFVATPLQDVLVRQMEGLRERLSDLETNEVKILDDWSKLAQDGMKLIEEPRFRIYQGRQQVFDLLQQMCERAVDEICLVTTMSDLTRLSIWGMDDRLRELSQKGKRIRVLTQVDATSLPEIEGYLKFARSRHIALPSPVRFAIIDERETLMTATMDDSMSMTTQNDTGLWTNAPSYVTAMKVFYDAVWSLAPDAESIIRYLKTGRSPQEIRIYATDEEYKSSFKSMVERCEMTLDIMAKNIPALPVPLNDLQAVADRGVKIRLLTHLDADSIDEVSNVSSCIQLMENPAETDLGLVVVDGGETLMNIPYLGASERTVWSDTTAYVGTMIQVFEDYWKGSEPTHNKMTQLIQAKQLVGVSEKISEALREKGWHTVAAGTLKGGTGASYVFDVVVEDPENIDRLIYIDMLTGEGTFVKIIELGAASSDLKPARLLLASLTPFKEEDTKLAEIYGIRLVYAPDTKELIARITQITTSI